MRPGSDAIVAAAVAWLGTPYRHQASTLAAGCDCLGLIRGVWRALYGDEPCRVPPYRAGWRADDQSLEEAVARYLVRAPGLATGRVVLFGLSRRMPPRHCGILISPTRFIHAQERLGVVAADLSEPWRRRVAATFDFPDRG